MNSLMPNGRRYGDNRMHMRFNAADFVNVDAACVDALAAHAM